MVTKSSHVGFSTMLVHEFKAPLADLLALIQDSELPAVEPALLSALLERLTGLQKLTDQLLQIAPNLSWQSYEWLDPDELLCTLISGLTATASAKQLGISYNRSCEPGHEFLTRAFSFELLVRNLTANAIKHSHRGSVDILLTEHETGLTVRISDCGDGINKQTLNLLQGRISCDQYRANSKQGIGALLARTAADQLSAEISITERPHDEFGTVIEVLIPGQWRQNQIHEESNVSSREMAADLSALRQSAPDLCKQLEASGFRHEPEGALKLNFFTGSHPHIVCRLGEVNIAHATYPCSRNEVREMMKDIAAAAVARAPEQLSPPPPTQQSTASAKPDVQAESGSPERLALVIDDSAISRRHLCKLLQSRGWLTVEADDHGAGARARRRCQFDLIIEDACLPGLAMPDLTHSTARVAISAEKDLAEGLTRSPGYWIDALVKPVAEQDFERMLHCWQASAVEPAWDLQLAKQRLRCDDDLAFACGSEILSDYLRNWPKLARSLLAGEAHEARKILHGLYGGLLYCGFPLLQQRTEAMHGLISGGEQVGVSDLDALRQTLRHAITVFKAQPGQNQKLGCELRPIKFEDHDELPGPE